MTEFDFTDFIEEQQNEYLFKRVSSGETKAVNANTINDAWDSLQDSVQDWRAWMLMHRKDIAESQEKEYPLQVSAEYDG